MFSLIIKYNLFDKLAVKIVAARLTRGFLDDIDFNWFLTVMYFDDAYY